MLAVHGLQVERRRTPRRSRPSTGAMAAIITPTDAQPADRVDRRTCLLRASLALLPPHVRRERTPASSRGCSGPLVAVTPCPTVLACDRRLAPVPPGLVTCRALMAYDESARAAVTALKNRGERARVTGPGRRAGRPGPGRRRPGRHLGAHRCRPAPRHGASTRPSCWPAPSLAGAGLPVASLLRRLPGPAQAGRSRANDGRTRGSPAGGAAAIRSCLIDDVATTGATLSAAAAALRAAGAPEVHALVVARAPRPAGR